MTAICGFVFVKVVFVFGFDVVSDVIRVIIVVRIVVTGGVVFRVPASSAFDGCGHRYGGVVETVGIAMWPPLPCQAPDEPHGKGGYGCDDGKP